MDIEALMSSSKVYVSDISNYKEALQAIQKIGELTNRQQESENLIQKIESSFSILSNLSTKRKKVCYLIWKDPIMTIGKDTFIHDMLDKCGFENIFGNQKRYPTVTAEEIRSKNPDYIFLSSEPFPFKEKHIEEYQSTFPDSKVILVDGEYFSWYGSRMVEATRYFHKLKKENSRFPSP